MIYSLSDLRSSVGPFSAPLSAPPMAISSSVDAIGTRERDHQFFFGRDFNEMFESLSLQDNGKSLASSSSSGILNNFSPALVPNNVYSLSDLRSSAGSFSAPLSAPPMAISSSVDAIGTRERDHQFFFGRDFNEMFESLQDNGKSLASSSSSGILNNFSPALVPNNVYSMSDMRSSVGLRETRIRKPQPTHFSLKVFLGGIPANMTTRYAFVVFQEEESIFRMLRLSFVSNGRLFFYVYMLGPEQTQHPVEVKVWEMKDTMHVGIIGWRKFRRYSVFVGGIPRTCTAAMLAYGVQEVIGPVAYCTIELDRQHCYPKGAACVVFNSKESYIKAIAAHDVVLSFGTFERKVEFKPFLATNMPCEKCGCTAGTRFCAEMICLAYYCSNCWKFAHSSRPSLSGHVPSKRFGRGSSTNSIAGK
uniref:RRM domain-containing protein n=1 Tax=Globodera rostochiensis TaxID=31243 RepID=A0A914GUV7_GLORO